MRIVKIKDKYYLKDASSLVYSKYSIPENKANVYANNFNCKFYNYTSRSSNPHSRAKPTYFLFEGNKQNLINLAKAIYADYNAEPIENESDFVPPLKKVKQDRVKVWVIVKKLRPKERQELSQKYNVDVEQVANGGLKLTGKENDLIKALNELGCDKKDVVVSYDW